MTPEKYSSAVRDELLAAAALGDDRTQAIAAALARTAETAVRLAVIDAVSQAATELSAELFGEQATLGPGAGGIRTLVDAAGVRFSVLAPAPDHDDAVQFDDGDTSARISLRLPESLKADIEHAAVEDNVSVNTWLVRVATAGVARSRQATPRWPTSAGRGTHRLSGWVTG
jgi:hypothetical protein